jgi:GTP-binding protein Era
MKELNLKDILKNTKDLNKEKIVWYVSIIWRPNTGKSSFVNSLIWEKISITTKIPQTTRKEILAVYNDKNSQIIFFDTPWIHKSLKKFNQKINEKATKTLSNADLILHFLDSSREIWEEEKYVEEILKNLDKPTIKVFTKSDLKAKIDTINGIKISSISKEWFNELIEEIKKHLKKWPLLFPEDYYTKQDIYFRINEIIREKVFLNTKDEIPHSIYIKTEEIEESDDLLKIVAYIHTETDSQKYIIIWKWWTLLTKIWKEARLELEKIFWKKVFLALRIKTTKNWRKNEKLLNKILD